MTVLKIKNSAESVEVNTVYCIGKNYADHVKEMHIEGLDNSIPETPVIFLKPSNAVNVPGNRITIPEYSGKPISNDLQNEAELVIVIGKDGENIPEEDAFEYIKGFAVGIDFTLRDIQTLMKKQGKPWAVAKGFKTSSPVSEITLKEDLLNVYDLAIKLAVNGELKQNGRTSQMIFSIKYIVSYLSHIFGLKKGDLIFTGTPAGVSTLKKGDKVTAEIEGIGSLNVTIG